MSHPKCFSKKNISHNKDILMIQVIHRAVDIIEYIATDVHKAHSLSEIAEHLKLNQATCANIIKTLVERNFIEQMGYKKGYKLGYMIYRLGNIGSFEEQLIKVSTDPMEHLRSKLNETCLLAILRKQNRVTIHQVNAERDLMVRSSIEKVAYNSASGRYLLAYLGDAELEDFIAKYGLPSVDEWPEATNETRFWEQIKRIRNDGYSKQVTPTHIIGFAYGIQKEGKVIASLSVYLPLSRLKEHGEKEIISSTIKTAQEIEKLI
ncbi:IclR family transcriptional regulator [Sphingobacterium humi]|uniref:Helix-turn-helix domain-containing protein n=1 Tax=Sphingobacterium humi TaxID=1796905 RepID=A0A6N8KUD6_9SPHI|nr:IclR family transcriptional regulator [Sphingobacterium humi]MVZ60676.1 helix-turn-helix domain-containing protein [Sphingobacterium humi]